jgi:hypothetical protein
MGVMVSTSSGNGVSLRRRTTRALTALAFTVLIASCAEKPPADPLVLDLASSLSVERIAASDGVADSKARIQFADFSILPPAGEHWIEVPTSLVRLPNPDAKVMAVFRKVLLPTKPHQVVFAMVTAVPIPAADQSRFTTETQRKGYLRYNMKVAAEILNASGLQLLTQKLEPDYRTGYDCYRWDFSNRIPHSQAQPGPEIIQSSHSLYCADPSFTQVVSLVYGQAFAEGVVPLDISAEGEGFLLSIVFGAGARV